tara:strand:- start:3200 stop:3532 length:333 start_codon:yes stop_codon:yes gene_type:complete
MKEKDFHRMWGESSSSTGPRSNIYTHPSYFESAKYFDADYRAAAMVRSWKAFKKNRPACAELLEILFGEDAPEVHLSVKQFSETRARLSIEMFKSGALRPSGDAFKITKM